ncbi:hypothetical protein CWI35_02840 [[Bacillus] caldolyticus]|uniref:MHYT domain-containing protein n=1 Tax=Bacillus caldolyticus TaxID=1394 RepID=A0ABM6QJR7_BACCL|nr:hypothetical protein [[Bacillus] caldolyticus]AUI35597.1 hypothetical protein CWI35_02840 [[Bacillus] caldolyticus]
MKTEMSMHHHPFFVCLSIAISFFASFLTLFILFVACRVKNDQFLKKAVRSVVLGGGIAAMHYISMKGTLFQLPYGQEIMRAESASLISVNSLAYILAFITMAILIMTNVIAYLERREVLRKKKTLLKLITNV